MGILKLLLNCCVAATVCGLGSCMKKAESTEKSWVEQAVENARCQIGLEIDTIEASGKVLNPVTLNENEQVYYCGFSDWRSGFFPGSVWYLYELTDDNTLLSVAQKYTEALDEAKKLTWHHDIGFIVNCSYGNGLRLSGKAEYKDVMIEELTLYVPVSGKNLELYKVGMFLEIVGRLKEAGNVRL